ncbi:sensor histidine kinase [Compostimonas suwonensis]|uniref:histidine kinase n=1 Tax=Compostimonas suwonensis TaxID=1048394 RepID=A0A2M9BZ08_9MICO|nr:ATP-binding protein [Compostimonas suwonensis]PJJ63321.1 histidine kinase/DNA gyrase B/HSP90-like ATPase [Compostimonas suwonensis]
MSEWFDAVAQLPWWAYAAAFLGLLALFVLFLVLWISARVSARRRDRARGNAEIERIELELALAEQTGRLRIVHDLQSVAVQSLSRLLTEAEGVRYAGEGDPDAAVRATANLVEHGRATLGDLRRVLTVAHEGEKAPAPQLGLESVNELVSVMRRSGLDIEVVETGERFELKQGADVAIYRILQAALANALKHGGAGTQARVAFSWTQDGLQLAVEDDGIRSAARRAGLDPEQIAKETAYTVDDDLRALTQTVNGAGLSNMRERAQLFGGMLSTQTIPGVGFSVSAVFPALRYHNGVHGVNLAR